MLRKTSFLLSVYIDRIWKYLCMILYYIFTTFLHIYSLCLLCKCWTACSLEQKLPLKYSFISALKYYSNFTLHCLQPLMTGPTVTYSFPNVLGVGEGLPKCYFYQTVYHEYSLRCLMFVMTLLWSVTGHSNSLIYTLFIPWLDNSLITDLFLLCF